MIQEAGAPAARATPDAGPRPPPLIAVRALEHGFGKSSAYRRVLADVSFDVGRGEVFAILGGSGVGKSTLMQLLAGLERPTAGAILLAGVPIDGPDIQRALVPQGHGLLPWFSAAQNVGLAVRQAFPHEDSGQHATRVAAALRTVGLADAAQKRPAELSGGMRQRVAVARALAVEPELLLLDEPFSALDALTRAALQEELAGLVRGSGRTVVLVTNDAVEALLLADRVAVLAGDGTLSAPIAVPLPPGRSRAAILAHAAARELLEQLEARPGRTQGLAVQGATPRAAPRPPEARVRGDANPLLAVRGVAQAFDGRAPVLTGVDLDVHEGEFVCLLGHSGCGKTTLLNLIAGFLQPNAGELRLDGREITAPGRERAMVFQNHALLPWLSAETNVRLGLEARGEPRAAEVARAALAEVGLGEHAARLPAELSAGMRQRVGLARALVLEPRLLLLDEPFGSLDSSTRRELQGLLGELLAKGSRAALMVTHDIDEALVLADRIALMGDGPGARIEQWIAPPFRAEGLGQAARRDPRFALLRAEIVAFLAGRGRA